MKTIKEYEVIGINGDDHEWCASSNDIREAHSYMVTYFSEYDRVELYEVSKCMIKALERETINFEGNDE